MTYRYPQGHVFYRNLHLTYPLIKSGRGVYLYDSRGKKYLDASGGAAVVNIGHGLGEVSAALAMQSKKMAYLSGLQFTHGPVERLAEKISRFLPFDDGKIYFLGSGSEAIEAAAKLARQYWIEKGQTKKHLIISRTPSYHGNTLAALSFSGRRHYQEIYKPLLIRSPKIPAPYCYRCFWGLEYPDCRLRCAQELEQEIRRQGEENVSAFLTEVIGGATTGGAFPPAEYFSVVRKICRKHKILLITDEVMTGAGRTGKWLAGDHFGLIPDIIVLGKGLTGGYFPLSALAVKKEIVDTLHRNGKSLLHAQTFSHHPGACAAGLAALDYMESHRLVERCAEMGEKLIAQISFFLSHPHVGDVRGKGLLVGVEFVREKETKKPFPRSAKYAEKLLSRAMEKGLVLWSNVGQADGKDGDLILLAPPYIISEKEISLIHKKLEVILSGMLRSDG